MQLIEERDEPINVVAEPEVLQEKQMVPLGGFILPSTRKRMLRMKHRKQARENNREKKIITGETPANDEGTEIPGEPFPGHVGIKNVQVPNGY